MKNNFTKIEYSKPSGLTHEAGTLSLNFSNAYSAFQGSSIIIAKSIEEKQFKLFLELRDKWRSETAFQSSGTEIISNNHYKKIIDLGYEMIPFIFRELKKNDDHWFYALEKLTGENPIKENNIGFTEEMKKDWLEWAQNNNY